MEMGPFPYMPTTAVVRHIGERKRGRQLSAPTQSDWCEASNGMLGEGEAAPNMSSNKGLRPPVAPCNPRIPVCKPFRDCAVLSR
jgi:hypothetical protein